MQKNLLENDKKLIELILEDVNKLEETLGNELCIKVPDPATVRILVVPILRRWICDKDITLIRNIIGRAINFPVYCNKEYIKACKSKQLTQWIGMVGLGEIYISTNLPKNPNDPLLHNSQPYKTVLDAKDFGQQKMIFIDENFFSRGDMISFAANKMGGTHNPRTQREIKMHNFQSRMDEFGLAVLGNDTQIMNKSEFARIEKYKKEGRKIYELPFLITLDTARCFIYGIKTIQDQLLSLRGF